MNEQSKILIRCDLCDALVAPNEIKSVKHEYGAIFLYSPHLEAEHFICHNCLEAIGWKEEKPSDQSDLSDKSVSPENEKPADTPNAAGSSDNTSQSI